MDAERANDAHDNDPIASIAKAMLAAQDGLAAARAEKSQASAALVECQQERDALKADVTKLQTVAQAQQRHILTIRLRWNDLVMRHTQSRRVEVAVLEESLATVQSENARLKEENKKLVEDQGAARLAAKRAIEALQSEFADDAPDRLEAVNDRPPARKRRKSEGSSLAKDAKDEARPRRSQRSTVALSASR
ncbi:hypothetical protein C8R45DRAFT_1019171 [Mycena sanguinolenta]|nr:hypothetical protein C8R45DRAFT_1019171 [Mycena sanguinolenta]